MTSFAGLVFDLRLEAHYKIPLEGNERVLDVDVCDPSACQRIDLAFGEFCLQRLGWRHHVENALARSLEEHRSSFHKLEVNDGKLRDVDQNVSRKFLRVLYFDAEHPTVSYRSDKLR